MYKFKLMLSLVTGVLLGVVQTSHASEADLRDELQQYVEIFNGNNFARQRQVLDALAYSGITDAKLYDLIAGKLMASYQVDDKLAAEQASWFAKALALSGNQKYKSNLNTVIAQGSKKIRKHAQIALQRLDQYSAWNPKISSGLARAASGQLAETRVKNMLDDADPQLLTIGAKRVYYAHTDNAALVMLVSERLRQDYQAATSDDQIDAVAWLIKAVAQSGDTAYKPLLSQIAETANNKKIAKYAKKYAAYL